MTLVREREPTVVIPDALPLDMAPRPPARRAPVRIAELGAPARAEFDVPWRELTPRVWRAWPLALPVASAGGALILTNGHGAAVAIAAMAATFAVIVVAGLLAGRLSGPQLGLILYGAGLA